MQLLFCIALIIKSEGLLFVWNLGFGIWNFQTSQVLFGSGLAGMCPSVAKKSTTYYLRFFQDFA